MGADSPGCLQTAELARSVESDCAQWPQQISSLPFSMTSHGSFIIPKVTPISSVWLIPQCFQFKKKKKRKKSGPQIAFLILTRKMLGEASHFVFSAAKYRAQRNYHILWPFQQNMLQTGVIMQQWEQNSVNMLQYPAPLSGEMCGPKMG